MLLLFMNEIFTAAAPANPAASQGAEADFSKEWAAYYRSMGRIEEAEQIEKQIASKVNIKNKLSFEFNILFKLFNFFSHHLVQQPLNQQEVIRVAKMSRHININNSSNNNNNHNSKVIKDNNTSNMELILDINNKMTRNGESK